MSSRQEDEVMLRITFPAKEHSAMFHYDSKYSPGRHKNVKSRATPRLL